MKAIFNKMTPVITSEGNDEIRAALFKNGRTTQKVVKIMIKQSNNCYSDLFVFSASAIRGACADTKLLKLRDYGINISEFDVSKVVEFLRDDPTFNSLANLTDYDDKEPFSKICNRFLRGLGSPTAEYIILPTETFDHIAKDCGYKVPLHLKKLFLQGGILAPSDSRQYDYKAKESDQWAIRMRVDMLLQEVE